MYQLLVLFASIIQWLFVIMLLYDNWWMSAWMTVYLNRQGTVNSHVTINDTSMINTASLYHTFRINQFLHRIRPRPNRFSSGFTNSPFGNCMRSLKNDKKIMKTILSLASFYPRPLLYSFQITYWIVNESLKYILTKQISSLMP